MMTIEEVVDQLAHDWMKKRCPELHRVIDAHVKAGIGKDAILPAYDVTIVVRRRSR